METLQALPGNCPTWIAGHTKHETWAQLLEAWPQRRSADETQQETSLGGYYTFGFVRHPWERLTSLYRYLVEKRPRPEISGVVSFEDFLEQADRGEPWIRGLHSMRPQINFLRTGLSSQERVNFVGHFEHLTEDFAAVAEWLNLPASALPHSNRSSNSEAINDYRQQFSSRAVEIVRRLFPEDIATFGYEFESRRPRYRVAPVRR